MEGVAKRRRGRPSERFVWVKFDWPEEDEQLIDSWAQYEDWFKFIVVYIESRPFTFRRRSRETREEFEKRLIPAMRELAREVFFTSVSDRFAHALARDFAAQEREPVITISLKLLAFAFYRRKGMTLNRAMDAVRYRLRNMRVLPRRKKLPPKEVKERCRLWARTFG